MAHRILIVDDDRTLRTFVKMILVSAGYETGEACNGLEALERVKHFKPEIILLDWMMPVMNGLETCKRLKQDPATKHIPVLMITVVEGVDRKQEALDAGCSDFMNKPIKKQEILHKLKWWTRRLSLSPAFDREVHRTEA
jgi:CheY-like chemotaxis protein